MNEKEEENTLASVAAMRDVLFYFHTSFRVCVRVFFYLLFFSTLENFEI